MIDYDKALEMIVEHDIQNQKLKKLARTWVKQSKILKSTFKDLDYIRNYLNENGIFTSHLDEKILARVSTLEKCGTELLDMLKRDDDVGKEADLRALFGEKPVE